LAYGRAARPKSAKLATNLVLRAKVEKDLERKCSPEQVTGRLRVEFPDDPEMQVSPETIYQSLYVQSRGALRRDLAVCLRTGRALRRPSRKVGQRKNRIPNMISISEGPPEVEDRAVPGNWEGDLIIGKQNQTAIGTLVERSAGYVMLLHLPDGYKPAQVRDALAAKIKTLPDSLRLLLTGDQGAEMRDWEHVSIDADIDIYFCDPHSPWQRGANENTNGPAAPVLSQGHRPGRAQQRRPGLGRPGAQRPTPQTTCVHEADRTDRRPPVAMTARIRRSATDTSSGAVHWRQETATYLLSAGAPVR
jgi:IS30 family transposase